MTVTFEVTTQLPSQSSELRRTLAETFPSAKFERFDTRCCNVSLADDSADDIGALDLFLHLETEKVPTTDYRLV